MKIVMLTIGSRGDVQPFVALGLELKRRGHQPVIVSTGDYRAFVASFGIEFRALPGSVEGDLATLRIARPRADADKLATQLFLRVVGDVRRDGKLLSAAWQACQGADVLLYTPLAFMGGHIAQALKIPAFYVVPQPRHAMRNYPEAWFEPLPEARHNRFRSEMGRAKARFDDDLSMRVCDALLRPALNRWRKSELDLPPVKKWSTFDHSDALGFPTLYIYSPHLLPRRPDWPQNHIVGGFCTLPAAHENSPGDDLRRFLDTKIDTEAAEKPIAICCGSAISGDAERFWSQILAAVRLSGQRAVIARGWDAKTLVSPSEQVFVADQVPLQWLMPRVSLLLCHGGIGTMTAAFNAAVPCLVVPFNRENWFWARAAHNLGVAPAPINRRDLDPAKLAQIIRETIADKAMRANRAQLQAQLKSENGAKYAAELIEEVGRL